MFELGPFQDPGLQHYLLLLTVLSHDTTTRQANPPIQFYQGPIPRQSSGPRGGVN
jgi:hypothetical protein